MQLVKKILIRFNGLYYPQEYLCFERGSFYQPLRVYLVHGYYVAKDITNDHLFIGYSPLVFALTGEHLPVSIHLVFSHRPLAPNEIFDEEDALARLEMKQVRKQQAGGNTIYYYEGTYGSHQFLTSFQQKINGIINERYNKKPGNVFLPDNLYKQVQIAYAVPRIISLITIADHGNYNLFPTDLHGAPDEDHYVISLRLGGKALEQVERSGRVLLSQVHARAYQMVYSLGKNHMQEPRPIENFPFSALFSKTLHWPLPKETLLYRELELADSFELGIHKILLFTCSYKEQNLDESGSLTHIHNSYATWRHKTGLTGNYLLR